MSTASTNNGGLQGGFDLFYLKTFATYKIDSLTSQWKIFDFFDIYFVQKFDFPTFHVLNFDFLTFQARILTYSKRYILWNLTSLTFLTKCFWLCMPSSGPTSKQERVMNETIDYLRNNPWQRLKTKLIYFKDFQWLPLTYSWLTEFISKQHVPRAGTLKSIPVL